MIMMKKMVFEKPKDGIDSYISILVCHQNRVNGIKLNSEMFPSFIDLIIWGLEHDSIPHLFCKKNTQIKNV